MGNRAPWVLLALLLGGGVNLSNWLQHGPPTGNPLHALDAEDRRAWLRDVRTALEKHRIPWTHWDYTGDFGVVQGPRGARVIDPGTVDALGLAVR